MKWNWGTGIGIAIISFMSFIMYFVINMTKDDKYQYDLVTEKYYQKELQFQDEIDATQNASIFNEKITLTRGEKGLEIKFPFDFPFQKTNGKVHLYRPSNKQLDFEIPLSFSDTHVLVPEERLVEGRWNIEISWNHQQKEYLVKKQIRY